MKSILRHSMLTLLSLSVLLGSVGVAFSQEFCLMAGVKTSALTAEAMKCCTGEDEAEENADDCCDEAIEYEKLEPVAALKGFNLQLPAYFPNLLKTYAPVHAVNQAATQRIYTYTDSSPPVYGRTLLYRLHTLIV